MVSKVDAFLPPLKFFKAPNTAHSILVFVYIRTSIFYNRIVGKLLAPEAFKVMSNMGILSIGVIKGHPEGVAIRDGL